MYRDSWALAGRPDDRDSIENLLKQHPLEVPSPVENELEPLMRMNYTSANLRKGRFLRKCPPHMNQPTWPGLRVVNDIKPGIAYPLDDDAGGSKGDIFTTSLGIRMSLGMTTSPIGVKSIIGRKNPIYLALVALSMTSNVCLGNSLYADEQKTDCESRHWAKEGESGQSKNHWDSSFREEIERTWACKSLLTLIHRP